MSMTEDLVEAMKVVVETRDERIKKMEKIPLFTSKQKNELLRKFHPDYKEGTRRKLRVGPNKGDEVSHEVANILESYSIIDPKEIDLKHVDEKVDLLIVGGGGAGCAAAITAHDCGITPMIATKLRLGDANTMMAQGGIQAADKPNDSPVIHYLDVMGGGGFHNVPELVEALVMDAPSAIAWLEDLGMMFDKEKDGTMITIHGGGTSRKRMHSARDYTGGEIMKTLRDEVMNREIPYMEFSPAVELLTDGKRCTGAVLYNMETREYKVVQAKAVALTTGGSGRLHIQGFPTTNHYGATGDGLVMAYRAGCSLRYMDTIQYHPTGAAYPDQILGYLITEKCRGLGAHLVNRDGERFVNELETRDAVAASIIRECSARKKGVKTPNGLCAVWLDLPMIDILNGEGTIEHSVPAMLRQYKRYGIDIREEPVLVYPTQHYQNGGIAINARGETELPGLFVAGEASGGVHGRNRLMGNSLLDVVVYGRRVGRFASEYVKKKGFGKLSLEHVAAYHRTLKRLKVDESRKAPMLLPEYREKAVIEHTIDYL